MPSSQGPTMWAPFRLLLAPLAAIALLAGCGEGFGPSIQTVSDPYTATLFTRTTNSETVDVLAAGASLFLILADQGTSEGRLFVPGGAEDGSDLDLSLEGTWTLTGSKVRLQHDADTFLRDIDLTASESQLDGEYTQGDETVQVRLTVPQSND